MNQPIFYRTLLEQMNPATMAQHSTINHHANGVQYLCLHRTMGLTVKLYLIERPENHHSGYLVNPHSHRYPFSSTVLAGRLLHVRFVESNDLTKDWSRCTYYYEQRRTVHDELVALEGFPDLIEKGESYWVDPHEIHTLRMLERGGPLLLGLTQFADTRPASNLYLPIGQDEPVYPDSRQPSANEMAALRDRCMELLR